MLLDWVLFAFGAAGFGLAGYLDLKTTEFPDWLPYSLIVVALALKALASSLSGNITILADSAVVGASFLGLGILLYLTKQWGDGDAWLLGALGFLFPGAASLPFFAGAGDLLLPFPVVLLFNFFLVSFGYLIVYSIALGLKNPRVLRRFSGSLKAQARGMLAVIAAFFIGCTVLVYSLNNLLGIPFQQMTGLLSLPLFFAFVVVFVHYGKFVEENLFKRQISVSSLRAGDVPVSGKWRVLNKKEMAALKRKGGKIWIKEGVRFAPVFLITLILTMVFGNLMMVIL
jgi:Flp pilus assembly protein protease CpaA